MVGIVRREFDLVRGDKLNDSCLSFLVPLANVPQLSSTELILREEGLSFGAFRPIGAVVELWSLVDKVIVLLASSKAAGVGVGRIISGVAKEFRNRFNSLG